MAYLKILITKYDFGFESLNNLKRFYAKTLVTPWVQWKLSVNWKTMDLLQAIYHLLSTCFHFQWKFSNACSALAFC